MTQRGNDEQPTLLTFREQQVLHLLRMGQPTKLIASSLCISQRCVKWHLTNIYRKLSVAGRVEAILAGIRTSAPPTSSTADVDQNAARGWSLIERGE
jgi:LuxR family transcriptional regulator, transcriptional regulator of spore coat protein